MAAYYWPVAATSTMFSVTRPILYAFLGRGADGEVAVAAFRVASDFAMIFHNPINQLRHIFVTFGGRDRRGVRRFMVHAMLLLTGLMAAVVFSPLGTLVLADGLGVEDDVLGLARQALVVFCLTPMVVTARNYAHSLLLLYRQTRGMAAGAVLRVTMTALGAWAAWELGVLRIEVAAAILVLGFAMEGVASLPAARAARQETDAAA